LELFSHSLGRERAVGFLEAASRLLKFFLTTIAKRRGRFEGEADCREAIFGDGLTVGFVAHCGRSVAPPPDDH